MSNHFESVVIICPHCNKQHHNYKTYLELDDVEQLKVECDSCKNDFWVIPEQKQVYSSYTTEQEME